MWQSPQSYSRVSMWAVGVHVGVQVLIVVQMSSVQLTYEHWIEYIFTFEVNGSNTMCGTRHNQLSERMVSIASLQESILAQIL